MFIRLSRLLFLLLLVGTGLVLAGGGTVVAAPLVLPGEKYRTLETAHFRVHYPSDRRDAALYIAKLAEIVHQRLEPRFQSGADRTHLVLIFRSDLINAYTTVYGMDRILLYLTAPPSGDFARYRDWIEQLLVHEYAHVLTLRPYSGPFNIFFRLIIGVPPNLLAPTGLAEGYAVEAESYDGTGRLADPRTLAVRDLLGMYDALPNLEEAMTGSRRWPYGEIPYLYGGRFVSFLRERCGDLRMDSFYRSWIPAFLPSWRLSTKSSRFSPASCGSIDRLYDEFLTVEKQHTRDHLKGFAKDGVTARQRLTFDGGIKRYLYIDENGLYYFAHPEGRSPGIYSLDTKDPTRLSRGSLYYRALTMNGFYLDRGVVVSSEEDLILPDSIIRNVLRRDGERIYRDEGRRESPAGVGHRFVYVRREEPHTYLVRGDDERVLLRLPDSYWLGQPAMGNKDRVAVVARRRGSIEHSLIVCDGEQCREIVRAKGVIAGPSFAADDRIVFSSDVDGVFDVFSVGTGGEVRRLTRSLTGLVHPILREDGLYAIGNERDGQEVFRVLPLSLRDEPAASLFLPPSREPWSLPGSGCETSRSADDCRPLVFSSPGGWWRAGHYEWYDPASPSRYRPGPGIDPFLESTSYNGLFSFTPFLNGTLGGPLSYVNAGFAGYDPLSRHEMQGGIGMYDMQRSYEFFSYTYSRYRPTFSLSYAGMPLDAPAPDACVIFAKGTNRDFCEGERRFSFQESHASLDLDLYYRLLRNHLSLSVDRSLMRNTSQYTPSKFAYENLDLTAVQGAFDLYYYETSAKSISPERGFFLSASAAALPSGATRAYGFEGKILPLRYERYEGLLEVYVPFFIDYHVPVLQARTSWITGRDATVEETRLSSVLPGLNPDLSPSGRAANYWGFEYRFPLWQSRTRLLPWFPSFGIRYLALAPFAATAQVREDYNQNRPENWTNTAGVRLTAGIYVFYQPLQVAVTYARGNGPAGEGQVSFGFSIGALPSSYGGPAALKRPHLPCPGDSCLNR